MNAPAVEYNFGALKNVQLHAVVQETRTRPQIGIFPMAELATGNSAAGLGNGRTWYRLPLWIQKSWGAWTTYGGGGYAINSAPGMRHFRFAGWLVQRDFGTHLTLGGEVYSQGAQRTAERGSTFYSIGGYVEPSKRFNILFSAGHSLSGESHAIAYFGLYWTGGADTP